MQIVFSKDKVILRLIRKSAIMSYINILLISSRMICLRCIVYLYKNFFKNIHDEILTLDF